MFDMRKLRLLKLRPELLEQLFRDGHVCEAGRQMLPLGTVPSDLTIVCAHFDHRERLLVLGVYSESFAPVPKGVDPPTWELAFRRDVLPPAAAAASTETEGGKG